MPLTREEAQQSVEAVNKALADGHPVLGNRNRKSALQIAAKSLKITAPTLRHRLDVCAEKYGIKPNSLKAFEVEPLPGFQAKPDEIWAKRDKEFARRKKARDARSLIGVNVRVEGPFAIVHMGDPHMDDPGTNGPLLREHIDIINRTEGMFGACVGDFINNWRGRLGYLHADQSVTQQEAWALVQWFLQECDWLYLIGGNHDVWSGNEDPLVWFTHGMGAIYEWHGARLELRPPSGERVRFNIRHNWPGSSIYNRTQGATKAVRFRGTDHVYLNGHKHQWAHYQEENANLGIVHHAIQVGAYKLVDDFQEKIAAEVCHAGPAVATIIDPHARSPHGVVKVDWDIEGAADYLTYLRGK